MCIEGRVVVFLIKWDVFEFNLRAKKQVADPSYLELYYNITTPPLHLEIILKFTANPRTTLLVGRIKEILGAGLSIVWNLEKVLPNY